MSFRKYILMQHNNIQPYFYKNATQHWIVSMHPVPLWRPIFSADFEMCCTFFYGFQTISTSTWGPQVWTWKSQIEIFWPFWSSLWIIAYDSENLPGRFTFCIFNILRRMWCTNWNISQKQTFFKFFFDNHRTSCNSTRIVWFYFWSVPRHRANWSTFRTGLEMSFLSGINGPSRPKIGTNLNKGVCGSPT